MRKIELQDEVKESIKSNVLRALEKPGVSNWPLHCQEETHIGSSTNHSNYNHDEIRNALLEAERAKARGIAESQKYRFIR